MHSNRVAMSVGAVTFLDVLGWKGIWERRDDAEHRLISIVQDIRDLARGTSTEVKSISDTIVILSEGTSEAALALHARLCSFAITTSIMKEIPLRGATCYGEYKTIDNIFLGPAIDEAASWYEEASWIGVYLTPSAWLSTAGVLPAEWVSYEPPLKSGPRFTTGCLRWLTEWSPDVSIDEKVRTLKHSFYGMGPLVPGIAEKYMNTLTFISYLIKKAASDGNAVRPES